jgi:ZIP family zinc transporter
MPRLSRLGLAGFVALVVLTGVGVMAGLSKVLVIAWVAFTAMVAGAALSGQTSDSMHAKKLVWAFGLASGAMITSAAVFLVPSAISHHPEFGGFGIAFGILVGFSAHTVGHRATHLETALDHTSVELTAHSLAAGSIIGLVYGNMPDLGLVLGLAIVSHKGPAGYVAAHRLRDGGNPASVLLLPAAGIGIAAISSALLQLPSSAAVNGLVFGFAAGVFLHVAMDFLPRCELGGEVYEVAQLSDNAHHLLDKLRMHAVVSTTLGGIVVFALWAVISGSG